jgi:1,5-anhydro-D-fructose reductase (1,5-anhydro-D-mannitol-forming)
VSDERLGWGVIGIGNILTTTIAPAMAAEPTCDLVAAVSRQQSRADSFAHLFGVRHATTSYDEMLANPEVEAVFIATPNDQHAGQVIAAARAGKHVLCDKPLATSVDDARAAVAACDEAGVKLGINFHNRYLPWVGELRRLVAAGSLGGIEVISAEVGSGPRSYTNWRADPAMAGLGSVYNVGVHVLDFIGWVLGAAPVEVMAMFDRTDGVEMLAMVLLRYDNGTMVHLNCNERLARPHNDIIIHGTEGRVVARQLTRARSDGTVEVAIGDTVVETFHPAPEAHRLSVAEFTFAVLSGSDPEPCGRDGLASMVLCDAIARSARERRLVEVGGAVTARTRRTSGG